MPQNNARRTWMGASGCRKNTKNTLVVAGDEGPRSRANPHYATG
jgi:hypothetical protein